MTPSALREIVADGLREHDAKLVSVIDRLETNDKEAAVLVGGLVDELTEAYSRMRETLSSEVLESFNLPVDTLSRLRETLDDFVMATYRLRDIPNFGDY